MQGRHEVGPLGSVEAAASAAALADLTRKLSAAGSPDEVMTIVSRSVRDRLQADGASFVLREGNRCYYAEEDAISPLWRGRRFPLKSCVSGWCMTHGEAVAIGDIYQDPRVPVDAYRPTFVRSMAIAPVGRDEAVAALGAYWAERRDPTEQDVAQLQAIADAAGVALKRVRGSPARPARNRPDASTAAEPFGGSSLGAFLMHIRRNGVRPNSVEGYAFAVLCVLTATLVRQGFKLGGAHELAVFSTYYLAVLVAMLVGGRGPGILAAALGGFAAYYFFMPPLYRFAPPTLSDALDLALYGGASALIILIIDWYKRAVLRLREEDATHLTLAREQGHRVKNAIAVAESVVRQSLRDQPERAGAINRRIRAGLRQIDIDDRAPAEPAALREILTAELEPYDLARFRLDGMVGVRIGPGPRRLVSLLIHELATNAVKHGALLAPAGEVTVAWEGDQNRVRIVWTESGGPPVTPPQRRGYGSMLMQRLIQGAGGAIVIEFPASGVRAEVSIPLD